MPTSSIRLKYKRTRKMLHKIDYSSSVLKNTKSIYPVQNI